MPWRPSLNPLRDALADLYPSDADARRIVSSAGLDPRRIAFHATAVNIWQSILEEAEKQGQVQEIVAIALSEYPRHAGLLAAREALSRGPSAPARAAPAPGMRSAATGVELSYKILFPKATQVEATVQMQGFRETYVLEDETPTFIPIPPNLKATITAGWVERGALHFLGTKDLAKAECILQPGEVRKYLYHLRWLGKATLKQER